ncbi:MAG: ATP-binding protein [Terrimicrobiaceae bacterium]|nr:ATP-binding protein [Terrimicrobiaceae bacterium]
MNLRLKFPADTSELAGMRHAARDFLLASGVSEMDAELMVLALDEACTNIIRYAYGGCTRRVIRLNIDRLKGSIRCILRDYGASCDPAKIRSRDLADFRPGGLGVRIMHSAFDRVLYEPKPRGTRLTLVKSIGYPVTSAAEAA